MRPSRLIAVAALLVAPNAVRAADVTPLYPDSATLALGIEVKGITGSPLGKKVIGPDKPYDATRKLLHVMFPQEVLPVADEAVKPLEAVANKLERVTVTVSLAGNGPPPVVVYLEGDIDAGDYRKAAEAIAKSQKKEFATEKLGERTLLVIGEGNSTVYGVGVSKSLFVIATDRDLITDVLAKHAGTKKANVQKGLAASLKKIKPAETPIWLAAGEIDGLNGFLGGTATIGLKGDAHFRIEVVCDGEGLAGTIESVLKAVVEHLEREQTPQAKVWKAAGIVVNRDGKTVVATGSIPGKLLADEYAKQK